MAESLLTTNNHDIAGMHRRINRFISEIYKCDSSRISEYSSADLSRLDTYLAAIRAYHSWVVGQPTLDLVETSPRIFNLEGPVFTPTEVENENIVDIIRLLETARDELVLSQSSRRASTLIPFDSTRFLAVITKVEQLISEYVIPSTPLDLPESSPQEESSGPGIQ